MFLFAACIHLVKTRCCNSQMRTYIVDIRLNCSRFQSLSLLVVIILMPHSESGLCVRRWNRTTVVAGLQPTAKPLSYSHILNLGRVLVIELQVDSQRPFLLDNSHATLVQLSTGVIYQSLRSMRESNPPPSIDSAIS